MLSEYNLLAIFAATELPYVLEMFSEIDEKCISVALVGGTEEKLFASFKPLVETVELLQEGNRYHQILQSNRVIFYLTKNNGSLVSMLNGILHDGISSVTAILKRHGLSTGKSRGPHRQHQGNSGKPGPVGPVGIQGPVASEGVPEVVPEVVPQVIPEPAPEPVTMTGEITIASVEEIQD